MSPDEREFGELLGEMRAVRQQMVDMERRNSEEHSAVMQRLGRLEGKLDSKVDTKWMDEQRLLSRVDSLEAVRDERQGMARLVTIAQGIGLFAIAFGGLLLAKGGL